MPRKITNEEFLNMVREKNQFFTNGDIKLLSNYMGRHTAIPAHCNIHNYDWSVLPHTLYEGRGCPHCSHSEVGKNQTMSHDEFVSRVFDINPELTVVGTYVNSGVKVKMQCKNGHIWSPLPQKILHDHQGCPYCAGNKIWIGYNDMWTTRPDIARLLKDPEDGYRYMYGSGKSVRFICPNCGVEIYSKINTVSFYGLACSRCGDGVSMPEKFGRAFLDQIPISNHRCEYQPEWAKPYFYDDYFNYNDESYIVEWDGAFHYLERSGISPLEQRKEVDMIKDELAIKHNIHIIRIDCLFSDVNYIRKSIENSYLNNIFDLSKIDWDLCNEKAQSNLVKEACNLYTLGEHSTSKIASILHICASTVCNYLKTGKEFGWCDYDVDKAKEENMNNLRIAIYVVDYNNNIIHSFKSYSMCIKEMKELYNVSFSRYGIHRSCETHKPYKGFNFRYANETIQN